MLSRDIIVNEVLSFADVETLSLLRRGNSNDKNWLARAAMTELEQRYESLVALYPTLKIPLYLCSVERHNKINGETYLWLKETVRFLPERNGGNFEGHATPSAFLTAWGGRGIKFGNAPRLDPSKLTPNKRGGSSGGNDKDAQGLPWKADFAVPITAQQAMTILHDNARCFQECRNIKNWQDFSQERVGTRDLSDILSSREQQEQQQQQQNLSRCHQQFENVAALLLPMADGNDDSCIQYYRLEHYKRRGAWRVMHTFLFCYKGERVHITSRLAPFL